MTDAEYEAWLRRRGLKPLSKQRGWHPDHDALLELIAAFPFWLVIGGIFFAVIASL